ncbi:nucleotidyltransferase domain-containing protein [Candidatus Woesearchaeota archaeon]|nr:nucleotidyltransferase domain-containing protein [Candidatus Woesearchaeota archaeon]
MTLFTNGFDKDYYVREVGKLLNLSPRTAQLILEDLEQKGVVASKTKGKIKIYKLQRNESTKKYLVFAEHYKSLAFLEKKLSLKEIIEKITPHIKGIGVLFGSYARGLEKEDSDVDIFVAGSYDDDNIKKVSKKYGIDINVTCYPKKTFEKNVAKDVFLNEVLKHHVVFLNAERFIQVVYKAG